MAELPQNTRREFLAGQSARDAVAALVDGRTVAATDSSTPAGADTARGSEEYLLKFARTAMACQFEFMLPAGRFSDGPETALAALDLVDQLEEQLTVYRDSSELMAINRRAADRAVRVEPRLFELLEFAFRLSEQTSGAYDITSGPLTKCWGFHRREGRLPGEDEIVDVLRRVGFRHVELNAAEETVRFRTPGVELNLGSIGKGYALDRCAELFRAVGVDRALLHGGQSSVVAVGRRRVDDGPSSSEPSAPTGPASEAPNRESTLPVVERDGWTVGVGDPLRPGRRLALVRLIDGALGTSGSSVQFFRHAGRRYAHILDPRTGWPAEGLLSATVLASTAAAADAYSTACYVLGLAGALELCERAGVAGAFVELPQGSARPRLHTCGFGPGEFRLVDENGE